MVLAIFASLITISTVLSYSIPLITVLVLRRWAGGTKPAYLRTSMLAGDQEEERKPPRDVRDKTYLIVGGATSHGLHLVQTLASHGAQIVLLLPSSSFLPSTTPPEPTPTILQLILLLRSSTSNERIYADLCDLGDLGSVKSWVTKWGTESRRGMVGDLGTRVEGLVFAGVQEKKREEEELVGRHALVQLLLPTLVATNEDPANPVSAKTPTRIIYGLSPFYSFLPSSSLSSTIPSSSTAGSSTSIRRHATSTLLQLTLLRELQRRLFASLPPTSSKPSSTPAPPSALPPVRPTPTIITLSYTSGFTRPLLFSLLPSWTSYAGLGMLLRIMLLPVIWVFGKSSEEASWEAVRCVMGEVEWGGATEQVADGKESEGKGGASEESRRPGGLYRDGVEIRVRVLEEKPESFATEVWESVGAAVENGLKEEVTDKNERKAGP
ncbi:short-chain dehydrogenase/reductase SDR family protein [Pseudohyphozyma bogoriensis]|nr:short-chain dehydrogenase/reductase SDR family protein [Pseudohyphozyma bogoriensis]